MADGKTAMATKLQFNEGAVHEFYVNLTRWIERLHRRFLDVISLELDRLGIEDINAVQALLLSDINEEVTVRELLRRAYHLGSSVSYNLKKLVENGYVEQERTAHDKRSVRVRLSDKGRVLQKRLTEIEREHAAALVGDDAMAAELQKACGVMRRLDHAWSDYIQFGKLRQL